MALLSKILETLARSGAVLTRAAALPRAILNRRRLLGQICQLDDRMLRDIGLTRQDVVSVIAEPLFRDPSISLRRFADERRDAGRQASRERQNLMALMRDWTSDRRAA